MTFKTQLRPSSEYYRFMGSNNRESWAITWRGYLRQLKVNYITEGVARAISTNGDLRRIIDSYERQTVEGKVVFNAPNIGHRLLDPALGKYLKLEAVNGNGVRVLMAVGENMKQIRADEGFICISPKSSEEVTNAITAITADQKDKRVLQQELKAQIAQINSGPERLIELDPLEVSVNPLWALEYLEDRCTKIEGFTPEANGFRTAILAAIDTARKYVDISVLTPEAMGLEETDALMQAYGFKQARRFWPNPEGRSRERVVELGNFVTGMLADYYGEAGSSRVFSGKTAKQMAPRFNEIEPPKIAAPVTDVLNDFARTVMDDNMRLANPRYIGHMLTYSPTIAVFGDALTSALNPNQIAFEVSPATTLLEVQVTNWLCHMMGYRAEDLHNGKFKLPGGTLTAGGTIANMTAMLVARNKALHEFFVAISKELRRYSRFNPDKVRFESTDITATGIWGAMKQLRTVLETPEGRGFTSTKRGQEFRKNLDTEFVILTSAEAHYSHEKIGGYIGIGGKNVIGVDVDSQLRMIPAALSAQIEKCRAANQHIIMVLATAGTTETGNIDPLPEIADIAAINNLWLHVDAAYGGAMVLSHRYADRVKGIEKADSITFDAHKWLFQPYAMGAALFKDVSMLTSFLKQSAPYVMQEGSLDPNLGSVSVQGSMRANGVKLYLTLKTMGTDLLGRVIDANIDTTNYLKSKLDVSADFEVLSTPQMDLLCFRYLPRELKFYLDKAVAEGNARKVFQANRIINKLNERVQAALQKSGDGWLSKTEMPHNPYAKFKEGLEKAKDKKQLNVVALRAVIMNPYSTPEIVDEVLMALNLIGESEFARLKAGALRDLTT